VINLRGKVIPVADLRLKFEMEEMTYTERIRIIVVEIQGGAEGSLESFNLRNHLQKSERQEKNSRSIMYKNKPSNPFPLYPN
jgi:hypothetical protein